MLFGRAQLGFHRLRRFARRDRRAWNRGRRVRRRAPAGAELEADRCREDHDRRRCEPWNQAQSTRARWLQPNVRTRGGVARLSPSCSMFVFESDRALEPSPRPYRRLAQIVLETCEGFPDFPEIVDEPAALGAPGEVMLELRPCARIQRVV